MLQVESYRETRLFQEGVEEGLEKGLEKGRQVGRQEGEEEAKIAIARRMMVNQRPLEEIADTTGLTLAQVEKLRQTPAQ